jgi:hypothetical protein
MFFAFFIKNKKTSLFLFGRLFLKYQNTKPPLHPGKDSKVALHVCLIFSFHTAYIIPKHSYCLSRGIEEKCIFVYIM